MLEVRNIAFSYGSRPILRDVSFEASPGEVICLVGANGAGKTTLLKVLATLSVPDSGSLALDGVDAVSRPLRYRRQLGYMPERIALYDDMRVKDYLNFRARLKGETAKRIRRRVEEACELCRLGPLGRKVIGTLSAGQRKRVAFADAVLLRPRVLLLDDFFSELDIEMREAAPEVFSAVAAFSSVVITGHELDDLARCSTRFLVLRDGTVSSSLPAAGLAPDELRAKVCAMLKGGRR